MTHTHIEEGRSDDDEQVIQDEDPEPLQVVQALEDDREGEAICK